MVRAAPIAGTAKNTIHDFLFTETLVDAITSDPGFNKGFYARPADVREGLLRHAKIWAVMSDEELTRAIGELEAITIDAEPVAAPRALPAPPIMRPRQ
jgi:homoserine acetyltransferase